MPTRFLSFAKKSVTDTIGIATSKDKRQDFLSVSLYRNGINLVGHSLLGTGGGFLFWWLATRTEVYEDEEIGVAAAAVSLMLVLAFIATLGFEFGIIKFLPNSGERRKDIANSCLTISVIFSTVIVVLVLAGMAICAPDSQPIAFLRENTLYLVAFVALCAMYTANYLATSVFTAERTTGYAVAQGLIHNVVRLIPLAFLGALLGTFGIIASWGIGTLVTVFVVFLFFLPRILAGYRPIPTIKKKAVKDVMGFSFANHIAASFFVGLDALLPLLVVNIAGEAENAYFFIAWAIGRVLFHISRVLSLSLFAEGSHLEGNLKDDTRRTIKLVLLLLVPAALLMFLIGEKLLLLFGEPYADNAVHLLWILILSAFPVGLRNIYFGIKRVQGRVGMILFWNAFTFVATLAGTLILLPHMGIIGPGIAWLGSSIIVSIFTSKEVLRVAFGKETDHITTQDTQ